MIVTRQITADVSQANVFPAITAKQGDTNSRFLHVTITSLGQKLEVPASSQVLINATRADGETGSFLGEVLTDGTVRVPLNSWILALDDSVNCDISIISADEEKLTTTTFVVSAQKSSNPSGEIVEDEDYDVLVELLNRVATAVEQTQQAANSANTAAGEANTAASSANSAASNANIAAASANTAAESANNATTNANNATASANTATANAQVATTNANNATARANTAAASAEQVINNFYAGYDPDRKYSPVIVGTASGETVLLTDSSDRPLQNLKIFGKSDYVSSTMPNLYNPNDGRDNIAAEYTVDSDGWITATLDNSSGSSNLTKTFGLNPSSLVKTNTEYTVVIELQSISGGAFMAICEKEYGLNSQIESPSRAIFTAPTTAIRYLSSVSSFTGKTSFLPTTLIAERGQVLTLKFRFSVIEDTTVTLENFVYQKFNNGVNLLPNPQQPIAIESITNPTVNVYAGQSATGTPQTATFPYRLNGVEAPASGTGANYTDENGKLWISDYVDCERGKLVRLVGFDKMTNVILFDAHGMYMSLVSGTSRFAVTGMVNIATKNQFAFSRDSSGVYNRLVIYREYLPAEITSIETAQVWVDNNPVYVLYALTTPTEINLTAEEIAAYRALTSHKPYTTLLTNASIRTASAGLEVDYTIDTKTYIDNKFNELAQQIIGG